VTHHLLNPTGQFSAIQNEGSEGVSLTLMTPNFGIKNNFEHSALYVRTPHGGLITHPFPLPSPEGQKARKILEESCGPSSLTGAHLGHIFSIFDAIIEVILIIEE
jgi:hypothetical protein